jgi:signal transduction histidine kinase/DNA-binding response OmpR family regulator
VRPSFPHTADNITFQFGGIDLGNPEKLRYQFQLQGHGNTWSSASPSSEVNYGTLAPGSYTFRVRGRHPGGAWSEAGEYPFTIRPPWWNTLWARLAYFSLAVGLFYRLRRIELKRQQLTFSLRLEQVEAERLKELDMVKSRLYTNITHEFRTPLTVILGMADQMESKPADPVKDRVRMIRRNGRHLLSLVNQMLDLAKIESHQMNLHLIQGDLAAYLGYVAESFRSLADQKDIRIRVIRPEAGVTMDFDEGKMLQVLSNLLSNAIKFTPPGGEVTVTIGQERGELIVEVADTGVGIHPDQLPFIFNKFYQADNSHTRQGEGTGIGLTLTKELVGLMGGHIGVESRPGQGTVFTVRVPIRHTADVRPIAWGPLDEPHAGHVAEDASAPGESASVTDMAGERPLVLVIEDNMDVMTYLVSCLGEAFQVVKAMDGITGIGKALEIVPDLVITDVMMPGKDGFEVCDTLKRDMRTSHVPVIILTAKASMEDRIAGLARGADVYLAKPFHPEELLIHIGNLIALRKRLQERYQHLDATPPASASADEQVEDAFLLRLRELIEAELDNADLSIEDICKRMAMSRMQLHRKIKALTDRSTSIYIRSIRLAHGRRLLAAGELNVSQTAYAVGFEDPNYFSRVFQEEFGILPSDVKAGQA